MGRRSDVWHGDVITMWKTTRKAAKERQTEGSLSDPSSRLTG
ncbi:MAG: hypothetical protein ACM3ZE_14710 [Myxococcales bacterium]